MIFSHEEKMLGKEKFFIPKNVYAIAPKYLDNVAIKNFWRGHTFGSSKLRVNKITQCLFKIGDCDIPSLDGKAYAIKIAKSGLVVVGENKRGLLLGYMTLLDLIKMDDDGRVYLRQTEIKESQRVGVLMSHFCLFPETKFWELEKFIRFCGALKYTHIILEFWGTLKYDCLKQLSWSRAFSKKKIKKAVKLANSLGMQIIPMFNHWGHASASRVCHGKHVVLDQNPALAKYFSEDGWCWRVDSPKVRDLLKNIREELIQLCGEGEYFHIGCDEAYGFDYLEQSMEKLCNYVNEVADDLKKTGRKTIMWGDMCLYSNPNYNSQNWYSTSAKISEQQDFMLDHLNKEIIIADWQYYCKVVPVETALVFKNAGFSTLLCPCDNGALSVSACVNTVKTEGLMGILHTTWNGLSLGMPYLAKSACDSYKEGEIDAVDDFPFYRSNSASVMRKVSFAKGKYDRAGWSKVQVRDLT